MSDPRGTGRTSKTVALVMLLVFFQVLVVAVLGLGAIARARDEGRREARLRADAEAREVFETTLRTARDEVQAALSDARLRTRFQELEQIEEDVYHGHASLLGTVYQVDPETGVIYWMDGTHRLWVPPAVRGDLIRQEREREARAASIDSPHTKNYPFPTTYDLLREHVTEFPFRLDELGFPISVGYAIVLVEKTSYVVEFNPTDNNLQLLEQALLDTLEVVALNRGREEIPAVEARILDVAVGEVDAAVAALPPDQMHIRRHVAAFRDAQRELADFRSALEVAVKEAGDGETIKSVGQHLVGLVPDVVVAGHAPRHLVARLHEQGVRHLVEESADPELYRRLGVELRLVDPGSPTDPRSIDAQSLRPWVGLALRADLLRVREPALPAGGPSELFYWGIILLSACGLGLGVHVLVRLYTREVRLARLKADFVSNLSHELKTPITSMLMFTEMLQEGQLRSEEDRQEGLAVLHQESLRLQRIVTRMLDVARREARGVPYERVPGDLNAPVRHAAERFRRIVTEPGLDLVVDLTEQPLPMLLDAAALDDVVTNLVSNGWKYRRGDEARILVRTRRRGRRAEVVVSDDGVGIPRSERRKVFEMFYRAEAYLTRSVAGTGLGLSLVRTIVRAHGGRIRIEEGEGGVGTLFRIRLPLLRASEVKASAAARSIPATAPSTEASS